MGVSYPSLKPRRTQFSQVALALLQISRWLFAVRLQSYVDAPRQRQRRDKIRKVALYYIIIYYTILYYIILYYSEHVSSVTPCQDFLGRLKFMSNWIKEPGILQLLQRNHQAQRDIAQDGIPYMFWFSAYFFQQAMGWQFTSSLVDLFKCRVVRLS